MRITWQTFVFGLAVSSSASVALFGQTPLGTAFTYQGQLKNGGSPASGPLTMQFKLFDAAAGGNQIGQTLNFDGVSNPQVSVTNGLFTVPLDFGAAAFDGNKRWLEIAVSGMTLSPRQELTATPHARLAMNGLNLGGHDGTYYRNAANLTGTLDAARMPANWAAGGDLSGSYPNPAIGAGKVTRAKLAADLQAELPTLGAPAAAGSVATGGNPYSVAVSGSYAYVANYGTNMLQVFNIFNPTSPTLVGSVATGSGPECVAVSGAYAYVVDSHSNALQVFNVSNPTAPTFAGGATTGLEPVCVAVSGGFAYVVNANSNTLQVFNVSNPAAPTLAGGVSTGTSPLSVAVSGSYAYVTSFGLSSLQVFDVSNPANPTLVGSAAAFGGPVWVALSGSYAYVVDYSSGVLQVFDISNPIGPALVGSAGTDSNPISVSASGAYACVLSQQSGTLQVFDVSNPAGPTLTGTVSTGNTPNSVVLSGAYAYVANVTASALQVFKVIDRDFDGLITAARVGIGTANPSAPLQVNSGAVGTSWQVQLAGPAGKLECPQLPDRHAGFGFRLF